MKQKLRKNHFTKEMSTRCCVKDCLYYASAFGGTELDFLQFCSTHQTMLNEGKVLTTKKGFKVKKEGSCKVVVAQ